MALLVAAGLTKQYTHRPVLRGVTFTVDAGKVVGVIGPNGAGKTTLLRIVAGLQQPSGGALWVEGATPFRVATRPRVAYFGGESTLPGNVRVHRWRALFHHIERGAPDDRLGLLSRGTRQMVGLRTLFALPALGLIVLDEPWEGLDPDAARWLTGAVRGRRETGSALLISSHRLHDLAGVCDSYVFLHDGLSTCVHAKELEPGGAVTGDALLRAFDRIRGGAG